MLNLSEEFKSNRYTLVFLLHYINYVTSYLSKGKGLHKKKQKTSTLSKEMAFYTWPLLSIYVFKSKDEM